MTLIIVESPAKALTIEKYLGSGYKVEASMGHLVDLPKSRLAIDIEHDFEPQYITVRGKGPKLKELLSIAARADEVLALVKLLHRPGSRIMGRHLFLQLQKQPVKCFHTIFSPQK